MTPRANDPSDPCEKRHLWIRFWAIPARHDDSNHRGLAMARSFGHPFERGHFFTQKFGKKSQKKSEKLKSLKIWSQKIVTKLEVTVGYGWVWWIFAMVLTGIFTQFSSNFHPNLCAQCVVRPAVWASEARVEPCCGDTLAVRVTCYILLSWITLWWT